MDGHRQQMDTDSNYMAISGETLEDVVKPEMRAVFEAHKKEWLAWDKWSGRTADDSALLEMLLCRGGKRKKQAQHEGNVKGAERSHVGAFQSGA